MPAMEKDDMTSQSVTVSHWPAAVISVVGTVVFGFFTALFITQGSPWAALFLIFAAVSFSLLLLYGKTTITAEGLTQSAPVGRHFIAWDEIKSVTFDGRDNTIVLKGQGKQLVLPGFSLWAGRQKTAARRQLSDELQRRRIPTTTAFAAFAFSRNTRVR
jgi:hypothetical protein